MPRRVTAGAARSWPPRKPSSAADLDAADRRRPVLADPDVVLGGNLGDTNCNDYTQY